MRKIILLLALGFVCAIIAIVAPPSGVRTAQASTCVGKSLICQIRQYCQEYSPRGACLKDTTVVDLKAEDPY